MPSFLRDGSFRASRASDPIAQPGSLADQALPDTRQQRRRQRSRAAEGHSNLIETQRGQYFALHRLRRGRIP